MTATELTISQKLGAIKVSDHRDGSFINQLPNWKDRDMTHEGRRMLLRLLQKYVPDHQQLYNAVIDEQLNRMAP